MNKRRFLWVLLVGIALFGMIRLYYSVTDDFRIGNITYEIPHHPEWEIQELGREERARLNTLLSQKFSYIGKGSQSYAFGSEDGKYVIKFFKFKHLKPSIFSMLLPNIAPFSAFRNYDLPRKQRKLNSVFTGYRLAFARHRDESGLLYIQLNPTHIYRPITVIDKIGLERTIDLGSVVFIIQEKGETLRSILNQLLNKGDLISAKQKIHQIIDLYLSEYQKGIYDRDHGVMHNTGFVGNKPLHLDVGKLAAEPKMKNADVYRQDLALVTAKIGSWLQETHPRYAEELIKYMEKF